MEPLDAWAGEVVASLRDLTDEALVRRLQDGDERAFAVLFERHLRLLRRYANRWLPLHVQRRVSLQDVLQETQIVAMRRFLDFEHRGAGSVRNWLLRILELKVREAVRHTHAARRAVEREVTRSGRPDTAQFAAYGATPSQEASAAELAEIVRAAMRSLPPHYQEVLRMAREERISLREIAERLDRSREAVKKTYARALARFVEEYERLKGQTRA